MRPRPKTVIFLILAAWLGACPAALSAALPALRWEAVPGTPDLGGATVTALAPTEAYMFAGTLRGLAVLDRSTRTWRRYSAAEGLPAPAVMALQTDERGVWVGTEKGLTRWENGSVSLAPAAARPLDQMPITALARYQENLYVGTSKGLYVCSLPPAQAAPVASFQDRPISRLRITGPFLTVVVGDDEVSLLPLWGGAPSALALEFNLGRNPVTALGAQADYLWLATDGSGLIAFDLVDHRWVSFARSGRTDANLTDLAVNGDAVWTAGYGGLNLLDPVSAKWTNVPLRAFLEHLPTALAVDGETLWVGTDDGKLYLGRTGVPFLRLAPRRRVFGAETVVWTGAVRGEGRLSGRLEHRPVGGTAKWRTQGASLQLAGEQASARLDLKNWPDGVYEVRATVRNAAKRAHTETFRLRRQTQAVQLTFRTGPVHPGSLKVMGEMVPKDVTRLVVDPGGAEARLDPEHGTFNVEVPVTTQTRVLQFHASDAVGRAQEFSYPLEVLPTPQVDCVATKRSVLPEADPVSFRVDQKGLGPVDEWELTLRTSDGALVRSLTGSQELPPVLTWDGRDGSGRVLTAGTLCYFSLRVREQGGWETLTPTRVLRAEVPEEAGQASTPISTGDPVLFDSGEANLKPVFLSCVETARNAWAKQPDAVLLLEGHADDRPVKGVYRNNQILSEARAQAVNDYLVRSLGVPADRVTRVGYGATRPVAPNDKWMNRYSNRRVEMFLVGK